MEQQKRSRSSRMSQQRQESSKNSEPKSYLELIQEQLKKYEQENLNEVYKNKQGYNLYEDLKIIVVIATHESHARLGKSFWEGLSAHHLTHRKPASLRSRYRDFLKYLKKDDFNTIITHLNEKGLKGYLLFHGADHQRKMKGISDNDHHYQQQQQHSPQLSRQQKQIDLENKVLQRTDYHSTVQKRKGKRSELDGYGRMKNVLQFINEKYLEVSAADEQKQQELEDMVRQYQWRKEQLAVGQMLEAHEVVNRVATAYQLDKQDVVAFVKDSHQLFSHHSHQVLQVMHQVSGDFYQVLQYYLHQQNVKYGNHKHIQQEKSNQNQKDQNNYEQKMFWSEKEDVLIKKVKTTNDQHIKQLRQNKTDKQIVNRCQYLGLENRPIMTLKTQ